jgi:xylulokinase
MKTIAGINMGTQGIKVVLYDWEAHGIVSSLQEPVDKIT